MGDSPVKMTFHFFVMCVFFFRINALVPPCTRYEMTVLVCSATVRFMAVILHQLCPISGACEGLSPEGPHHVPFTDKQPC